MEPQQNPNLDGQTPATWTPKPRRPLPSTPTAASSSIPPSITGSSTTSSATSTPTSTPARPNTPVVLPPEPSSSSSSTFPTGSMSYASSVSSSNSKYTPIPPSSFYGHGSTSTKYTPPAAAPSDSTYTDVDVDPSGWVADDRGKAGNGEGWWGNQSGSTDYNGPGNLNSSAGWGENSSDASAWGIGSGNGASSVPGISAWECYDPATLGLNADSFITADTDNGGYGDYGYGFDAGFGFNDDKEKGAGTMDLVPIDGRCVEDEEEWWDVQRIGAKSSNNTEWTSSKYTYPSSDSTLLPPLLANHLLHDPEHTLFEVVVAGFPDSKPSERRMEKDALREAVANGSSPPPAPTSERPPKASRLPSSPLAPPIQTEISRSLSTSSSHGREGTPGHDARGKHIPPTQGQVLQAIPHPKAYYCPRDNEWVLIGFSDDDDSSLAATAEGTVKAGDRVRTLMADNADLQDVDGIFGSVGSRSIPRSRSNTIRTDAGEGSDKEKEAGLPPLSKSFKGVLPDLERRRNGRNCVHSAIDSIDSGAKPKNKTHHLHFYHQAVDAGRLEPVPFRRGEWESESPALSLKEGDMDIVEGGDAANVKPVDVEETDGDQAKDGDDQLLLDLYICCQCPFWCVVSPSGESSSRSSAISISVPSTFTGSSPSVGVEGVHAPPSNTRRRPRGIPGVIPNALWTAFIKDRLNNPNPALVSASASGKGGGVHTLVVSLETLLIVIQNHLWKGEGRKIKVNGPGFSKRLGWNLYSERVLLALGFTSEVFNGDRILRAPVIDVDHGDTPLVTTSEADSEGASVTPKNPSLSRSMSGDTIGLRPSSSDTSKPQPQTSTQTIKTTPSKSGATGTGKSTKRDRKGRDKEMEKALERAKNQTLGKANRAKLLRAWVEISAWFVDWKRRNTKALSTLPSSYNPHDLHIALNTGGKISPSGSVSVREMYQSRLGAHVDQLSRSELDDSILQQLRQKDVADKLMVLGLTPGSYSPDLLTFAYLAQRRCSPLQTPLFFTALSKIMKVLVESTQLSAGGADSGDAGGGGAALDPSSSLLRLYMAEDEKGRWHEEDLDKSVRRIGFDGVAGCSLEGDQEMADAGSSSHTDSVDVDMDALHKNAKDGAKKKHRQPGFLQMEYDQDVPEEFIVNAWRECVKRMSNNSSTSSSSNALPAYNLYDSTGGDTHMWDDTASTGVGSGQLILYDGGGVGAKVVENAAGVAGEEDESNPTPRQLNEALRIIAQSRGSRTLMVLWESCKNSSESPEKAYDILEVPKEIDDGMLITVYSMRVEEQPMQLEKMQQALFMIAEIRDSVRLREFARTSKDPGEYVTPTRSDWPRGLNQLGNTCYLNSLLQYFYTIKELRSSVLSMGGSAMAAISHAKATGMYVDDNDQNGGDKPDTNMDMKLSDDVLKKHRVGGRLVTRREIVRSKQFVSHLADLFHSLEYADNPAVTPSLELAKLALVTSKDEEVDDESTTTDKSGSAGGSDDTDATLVDDIPGLVLGSGSAGPSGSSNNNNTNTNADPPNTDLVSGSASISASTSNSSSATPPRSRSPTRSPTSSVLGKRPRDLSKQDTELLDSTGGSGSTSLLLDASPPPDSLTSLGSISLPISASVGASANVSGRITPDWATDIDTDDIVMRDASPIRKRTPPPLPPRKNASVINNESVMMFGKQHDVAECMDNCMFQIETALLNFDNEDDDGMGATEDDPDSEKASVVKRLFYGKIRQTFTETVKGEPTIHSKTDLFAHLPVNVGADVEQGEFGFDIYDGLGRYFDDTIEYEGQKVPMEVGLVKVPPLLQVQLQRVQFNRELLQSWKSQAYVKFYETLYMDRFMDSADREKRKLSKDIQDTLNGCRERLKQLSEGKGKLTNQQNPETARDSGLSSLDIEIDIPLVGHPLPPIPTAPPIAQDQEHDLLQIEITELRQRIPYLKSQLERLWQHDTYFAYELTSVFIHRGSSPSFGHYFFYSRNLPDKPNEWFKYNDEDVTEITKEEVLKDTTGDTANPYLLVFTRKGSQVVETVNRFDSSVFDDDTMS